MQVMQSRQKLMDYLLSRPDVDPARIGCVGLSGGGFRTAMAIAADICVYTNGKLTVETLEA